MTTAREYLTGVKARVAAAEPGPWQVDVMAVDGRTHYEVVTVAPEGGAICNPVDLDDAELIAHAPTDLARMEAALAAALYACDEEDNPESAREAIREARQEELAYGEKSAEERMSAYISGQRMAARTIRRAITTYLERP